MAVTFDHNKDGSIIVKLDAPIKLRGEEHQRLTIPAIKGKHMRLCTIKGDGSDTVGTLIEFAAQVVEPIGSVDELEPMDAVTVAGAVRASIEGKAPTAG